MLTSEYHESAEVQSLLGTANDACVSRAQHQVFICVLTMGTAALSAPTPKPEIKRPTANCGQACSDVICTMTPMIKTVHSVVIARLRPRVSATLQIATLATPKNAESTRENYVLGAEKRTDECSDTQKSDNEARTDVGEVTLARVGCGRTCAKSE